MLTLSLSNTLTSLSQSDWPSVCPCVIELFSYTQTQTQSGDVNHSLLPTILTHKWISCIWGLCIFNFSMAVTAVALNGFTNLYSQEKFNTQGRTKTKLNCLCFPLTETRLTFCGSQRECREKGEWWEDTKRSSYHGFFCCVCVVYHKCCGFPGWLVDSTVQPYNTEFKQAHNGPAWFPRRLWQDFCCVFIAPVCVCVFMTLGDL